MTYSTTEIMDRGMDCLVKNLGTVDAAAYDKQSGIQSDTPSKSSD